MTVKLLDSCRSAGLDAGLFHAIKGNPTGKNVDDGVAAFKAGGHDGVIAFGGGSALDAAKAIALMAGQDRPLWDFEDVGDNHLRVNVAGMAPVVAIPTTAGTGSEVGRASVITDEREHVKRIIFHAKMLPAVVILDPELTVGLPPKITAATGMDALSHSLEAYCSPFYHPMAVGIAVEGIRLVKDYLPRACENGSDLEARLQMLVASSMGATAFQRGLGAMHALAHPLGALYDAHHGLLNAILMPYVLRANQSVIASRIGLLARYLELPDPSFDSFLDWVLEMRGLGIPHTLRRSASTRRRRNASAGWRTPMARPAPIRFHSRRRRMRHPGERGRRRAVATPSCPDGHRCRRGRAMAKTPQTTARCLAQCHRLRAGMPGTVAGEA